MTTHELAHALLAGPDTTVELVIKGVGEDYENVWGDAECVSVGVGQSPHKITDRVSIIATQQREDEDEE